VFAHVSFLSHVFSNHVTLYELCFSRPWPLFFSTKKLSASAPGVEVASKSDHLPKDVSHYCEFTNVFGGKIACERIPMSLYDSAFEFDM
jgi:hypothetical protein